MINILGTRMVMMLALAAILCAGTGAGYLYYLEPTLSQTQMNLSATEGQVRAKTADIAQIKQDIEALQQQIVIFEEVKKKGFLTEQEREVGGRVFTDASDMMHRVAKTDITNLGFKISTPNIVEREDVKPAGQILQRSDIKEVKLDTLADKDVYQFLDVVRKNFPGILELKSLKITRTHRVDNDEDLKKVIEEIKEKGDVSLVKTEAEFSWWSMIPKPAEPATPVPNGTGG